MVALVAMSIAFPLALLTALYISEYAPARMKLDSGLAGRPDGRGALDRLGPLGLLPDHAARGGTRRSGSTSTLGWIPIFDVKDADPNAAVVDMLPLQLQHVLRRHRRRDDGAADGLRRDAPGVLPDAAGEKEAALALGATKWGMVRSVVLPFGRGGIIGGTMLGLGRALGETIAVLLILSPSFEVKPRILEIGGNTVSALIAGRFGDAAQSQLSALLAAGFVLFMITLVVNTLAAMIVNRSRSGAGTDA